MNVLRHVNAINMGVCILIWVIGCANAKVLKRCILPAPDGGVEKLSKPNLHGVIKKVDLNTNEAEIKIKEGGAVSFIFNEETLLSLIHISEPTRHYILYLVCRLLLEKKKKNRENKKNRKRK